MSDMHLIMENWNKFLDEAELDDSGTEETTATGAKEDPTEEQIEAVRDLVKTIAVLADAVEDTDTEAEEAAEEIGDQLEEGAGRKARMARKSRQHRTKQIKKMAGLSGVKMKDFTSDQQQLYADAKKEIKKMDEVAEFNFINTLMSGNVLEVPAIKQVIDKGGTPLKLAITAVLGAAGASACVDELTLMCLAQSLADAPQGG
jgi:hypothetical protein